MNTFNSKISLVTYNGILCMPFLPIGQEYLFLELSEIFLSRPAISAHVKLYLSIIALRSTTYSFDTVNLLPVLTASDVHEMLL